MQEKYLRISQHWGSVLYRGGVKMENPVAGKRSLTNLRDLENLKEYHGWSDNGVYYKFSNEADVEFGMETYEVKPDGGLTLVGSHYDTSD